MDQNYSLKALLDYCDSLCEANPTSKSKYKGWKTAANSVLGLLTDAQKADVRTIDIRTALDIYAGQRKPKPKTKMEYRGRVTSAVSSFLESVRDGESSPSEPQDEQAGDKVLVRTAKKVSTEANTFTFPIRKDFKAQFILPIDLTVEEAQRVCKVIEVLPLG